MSRIVHGTLKPNKVKTVGIDAYTTPITVVNRSGYGTILFTVDSSIPAAGAPGTFECVDSTEVQPVDPNVIILVRMLSADPIEFSVIGVEAIPA